MKKLFLLISFLALFGSAAVYATDSWSRGWNEITWDVANGVIHHKIRYYQTWGSIGDGHSGYANGENKGGARIQCGTYVIIFNCNSDGDLNLMSSGGLNIQDFRASGDEYEKYLIFDVPITQQQLNTEVTTTVSGTWWRRGATADNTVNESWTTSCQWERPPFQTVSPVATADYACINNRPAILIPWTRATTGNAHDFGDIVLYNSSGSPIECESVDKFDGTANSGNFVLYCDGSNAYNLNSTATFQIEQNYQPTKNAKVTYSTVSNSIVVRAYPQVIDFKAEPNLSDLKIQLNWSLKNAPVVDYVDDNFVITCIRMDTAFAPIDTTYHYVAYTGGQTAYEYSIPVLEGEDNYYNFTIERETTRGNDCWAAQFLKTIDSLHINTNHFHPVNPHVVLSDDQKSATITWDIDGTFWSEGSRFVLTRINTFYTSSDDIAINKNDFLTGQYVDNMIRLCNSYQYKLTMTPNDKFESITPVYTPAEEIISPVVLGTLDTFNVSKGYYSDKTEITWSTTGSYDEYYIERRIYGSDQPFQRVKCVQASTTSSSYVDCDETSLPGTVYDYRIYGKLQCGEIIYSSDTLYAVGFRTPTGDFYGRVTFESGQGVDSVEVRLETDEVLTGQSVLMNETSSAVISSAALLSDASAPVTLQAWVKPASATSTQARHIIYKERMYDLAISAEGKPYFQVGNVRVAADSVLSTERFTHLTAVYNNSELLLYINGLLAAQTVCSTNPAANTNLVSLGSGFVGNLDEVRIWNRALESNEITTDYTRYLVGNEADLVAYYTFDFVTENAFYDQSFFSTVYNGHDGVFSNITLAADAPSVNQLAHKAMTDETGTYSIRAVPYYGNGTAYTLTPRKGVHQFAPVQEIRFINNNAQSHTVNFIDNSSFLVSGKVVYEGGNYPVEGAYFTIDGVPALKSNGNYIYTDDKGEFQISVPVGVHEVMVKKEGHQFVNDGRLTTSNGQDRNYQDILTGVILEDATKVIYMGRVCGGVIEEAYPVGFSLSSNNLSDNITVRLTPQRNAYRLQEADNVHSDTIMHHVLKKDSVKGIPAEYATVTDYNQQDILIHVDNTTGEFVARVYPEQYTVTLGVYGHTDISGDQSSLNLTQALYPSYETYEYTDTVPVPTDTTVYSEQQYENVAYIDSVPYMQKQVFTKRYRAQIDVYQLDESGERLPYFGEEKTDVLDLFGNAETIWLYNKGNQSYALGLPVFQQNARYRFGYEIFEAFPYYIDAIGHIDSTRIDRVPVDDAEITFANSHFAAFDTLITDSRAAINGRQGYWEVHIGEPDLTTAIGSVSGKFVYGKSDSQTTVNWDNPLGNEFGQGYILGSHMTGTNFVTAGPNKPFVILRDPPGSNSYSYLEKGTTFTSSNTYTGGLTNEGSEVWTTGVQAKQMTVTLSPTGQGSAVTSLETETGASIGVEHSEEYTGSNSKTTSITTTTVFQTSDDPAYVGADADVFVGTGTNITFGSTLCTTVIPRAKYDSLGADAYVNTYLLTDQCALVENKGLSMASSFSTLYAYTQQHIENILIPNLEDLRNGLILLPGSRIESQLQDSADINKRNYYVSTVPAGDDNFGLSGFYNAYLSTTEVHVDTIETLNQSIQQWKQLLSYNDSVKAVANNKLENYSFDGGAPIEYSEQYATVISSTQSFTITVGAVVGNDFDFGTVGNKTKFEFEEHASTNQGGEFSSEYEASHTKGFVLAEDGDDYISVDVFYEGNKWVPEDEVYKTDINGAADIGRGTVTDDDLKMFEAFPTFVFRTRGGATSCPYEKEYTAVHWLGHENEVINAATVQREDPMITADKNFVENIPSGETAYFTLNLRNNSDTGDDQWFDIMLDDQTNPGGAIVAIDGSSISGHRLEYLVPAGDNLVKTLTVRKGRDLNYDDLAVVLMSQCQADPTGYLDVIADTVFLTAHFTPSCTSVDVTYPSDNWTYNTKCAADTIDGVVEHYMPVRLGNFDVNYTDFDHIELQYKPASASDNEWVTLVYYYDNDSLYQANLANGLNAVKIKSEDLGTISYNFYMDDLPDQRYDIRAVSFCNINEILYSNPSGVINGIKDMYNPRLFGSAKPANGILTVEDEIRLDFNETIAEGLLTSNNFTVTGIRNGAATNHDVSVQLDGKSAYMTTELEKNYSAKDLTIEGWILLDNAQNATIFSHGNASSSLAFSIAADNTVSVRFGSVSLTSAAPAAFELGSWNHVALVYSADASTLTAYVNWVAVIEAVVPEYMGIGQLQIGRDLVNENGYFNGKVDQFRVWNAARSSSQLQANSAIQLSGNDVGLIGYYAMDEARGENTEDKARGLNMMLRNAEWALPDGFATQFDGSTGYLAIPTGAAVVKPDMDYTLEFWFKTNGAQQNTVMLGNGDGKDEPGISTLNLFSIGWNANGALYFRNNGYETEVPGKWDDGQWHNFAFTVSRSTGHARIYMDSEMITYISADMVGGMENDRMFVGARVWHNDANDILASTADRFFSGSVDEVRLWKLYRTQSQMESMGNEKLDGNELGLLFYYPFEKYIIFQGVPELQYTLDDYVVEATSMTAQGLTASTADIAPVRTKGAVSSLLYDFVVNDDALIITLKEDDYRIENTIVNFTVEDVRDINGNSTLSPITWSAYIDRNQLMWQDDEITVSKQQYEDLSFTVGITNKGGYVQNYTIQNLPSWLSASPASGTLNPTKSQTITFTVNPGLNVGTYNEVIYLVDAENVSEPLDLTVTVLGKEPAWDINPADYQYNMSIFGQIRIDGVFSNDKSDIIAAFSGIECVGTTRTTYNEATDMYYVLLTVYSNTPSADVNLNFRVYDASTGVTYMAAPSETIRFSNNAIFGTPMNPVIFDCNNDYLYCDIQLTSGWNWVSFNLQNDNLSNLGTALAGTTWESGEQIKTLDYYADYSSNSQSWVYGGGLRSLGNTSMYMVHANSDKVLPMSGSAIEPTSMPLTILPNRWNWISYLPSNALSVKTALAGYNAVDGDIVKSQDGFAMYFGNEWIGSLTFMKPGEGYMLMNSTGDTKTLTYPSKASTVSQAPMRRVNASKPFNMSVFAHYSDFREGDIIYAVVNGEICGEAVAVPYAQGMLLQCISVAGTDLKAPVQFILVRDGETFNSTTRIQYASNAVYGTPDAPVEIEFAQSNITASFSVYPVPAVDYITVSAALPVGEQAHVEIYDLTGMLVLSSKSSTVNGLFVQGMNVSALPEGIYTVRLVHADQMEVTKFVKL